MNNEKFTFEVFEECIKAICDNLDLQDSVNDATYHYNDTTKDLAQIIFPTNWIDSLVHLLEILTNDKNEWISYWLFELERGMDYHDGCVTEADGTIIPLKTPKDLWNLLKSEQN